jgi:hypothetical protein
MSFECWILNVIAKKDECHLNVGFFYLFWHGQYVFESRKDSIGVVSFELWYACVLRVIRVAQTAD